MRRTLYNEGFDAASDDLENSEEVREREFKERQIAIMERPGVAADTVSSDVLLLKDGSTGATPFVLVSSGYGYTVDAERVVLYVDGRVQVSSADDGKFVYIAHRDIEEDSVGHPITGVTSNTRRRDDYSQWTVLFVDTSKASAVANNPSLISTVDQLVQLGQIVSVNDGAPSVTVDNTIDVGGREIMNSKVMFLDDEGTPSVLKGTSLVNFLACKGTAVGGRTITNPFAMSLNDIEGGLGTVLHIRTGHTDGIVSYDRVALTPTVVLGSPDSMAFGVLDSDEAVYINGQVILSTGITDYTVTWTTAEVDAADPAPGTRYYIYLEEQGGPILKSLSDPTATSVMNICEVLMDNTGDITYDASADDKRVFEVIKADQVRYEESITPPGSGSVQWYLNEHLEGERWIPLPITTFRKSGGSDIGTTVPLKFEETQEHLFIQWSANTTGMGNGVTVVMTGEWYANTPEEWINKTSVILLARLNGASNSVKVNLRRRVTQVGEEQAGASLAIPDREVILTNGATPVFTLLEFPVYTAVIRPYESFAITLWLTENGMAQDEFELVSVLLKVNME